MSDGKKIDFNAETSELIVPNTPIIPFIEGDGIGLDVVCAAKTVIDAAVANTYSGEKKIIWKEILAGEKAHASSGEYLPADTVNAIRDYRVTLKGPLTTPISGGFRSLNVFLRQTLDLYACVRPVRHFSGVPSPIKEPQKLDIVIFRENTEDVYAGIEWESGSAGAKKIIDTSSSLGKEIPSNSAIGIKPVSPSRSKRLIRAAIKHAIKHNLPSVTLMHKGNIMKFTEGAFMEWGYELARDEFADSTIAEKNVGDDGRGEKVVVNDRIADSMFQQILLRSDQYNVIATTNLNGDYISDAAAAQVGGIGIAPGANINYETGIALFEATHGSAPKYTGMDKANPSSVILSGVMMLEHLGWQEAADSIVTAMEKTFIAKTVTYDFARQLEGATELKASEFASAVILNMQ